MTQINSDSLEFAHKLYKTSLNHLREAFKISFNEQIESYLLAIKQGIIKDDMTLGGLRKLFIELRDPKMLEATVKELERRGAIRVKKRRIYTNPLISNYFCKLYEGTEEDLFEI